MAQFSINIPVALPPNVSGGKVAIWRVLDNQTFGSISVRELPSVSQRWARLGMDTHRLVLLQKGDAGVEKITHRWNPLLGKGGQWEGDQKLDAEY